MFALGLQGSPRKKGNSDILLSRLMQALADRGIHTESMDVTRKEITPCKEMTVCEKKGYCPIDDDMGREVYGLLRKADIVVAASPVFFYGVSSQLKALIDRCQTLWARRYVLKLKDPGQPIRRGYLLSVGATGGKQLFDGIHLTVKYFFDGIGAAYSGSLTYRRIEGRGQILDIDHLETDIDHAAEELTGNLTSRRRVLFVCGDGSVSSPIAFGFTRLNAGHRIDAAYAGIQPAEKLNPMMVDAMAEKGLDMAFLPVETLEGAIVRHRPDEIIALGCRGPDGLEIPQQAWDLPVSGLDVMADIRRTRDAIEQQVDAFIAS